MRKRKVFTTGQIAELCEVAPRTVSKWFDSGLLKGYRIPGSQDRRIPREELIKFLKAEGMPLYDLEAPEVVLIVTQNPILLSGETFKAEDQPIKLVRVASAFNAGISFAETHPLLILIDLAIGEETALFISRSADRKAGCIALYNANNTDASHLSKFFFKMVPTHLGVVHMKTQINAAIEEVLDSGS